MNQIADRARELARLRFDERNNAFRRNITAIKQNANSRGLLNSSITIAEAHKALEQEFRECAQVIEASVMDIVQQTEWREIKKEEILSASKEILVARKEELEHIYLADIRSIRDSLANSSIIEGSLALNENLPLLREELILSLGNSIDLYVSDSTRNIFNKTKNRFFNRRIVVVSTIVILVTIALANFSGAVRSLYENMGRLFGE